MSAAAAVRAFLETVWNARQLARFDEFVAPSVAYHPARGPDKGYDGYRAMVEAFLAAFPDLRFDVLDAVEQDGKVALRLRIRGTHRGEHLDVAPTGRAVDVQGRPWFRVAEGKVVEVWPLYDERGMLDQMGR